MARCVLQSQAAAITGLETNVMSWGQFWNYDYVPLVAAYKSLDTRHLTHLSERWTTDRTDGLHHFFFNGIGYESWESIWSAQTLCQLRIGQAAGELSDRVCRVFGQGCVQQVHALP